MLNDEVQPDVRNAAAVCVKLPEFWKTDPEMWFAQAEAQFVLANVVKDDTKFYHIVAKVDQSVICHITDLVSKPPQQQKYQALKARFALSSEARLERLLNASDLGDMRPTHLLAKMQEKSAGLNVNENLLKMLFLQRMPAHIRPVLTISDGTLAKLAEMADKMLEQPQDSTVSTSSTANDQLDRMNKQIEVLSADIRRLKANPDTYRSRSSSRSRNSNDLCWYHQKYGAKAQRCKQPCQFRSKN
ncbi:uncharacterized protein LOC131678379 [Topomyia yanbarensis]|uniref:uncharacterized protein LOC131678379 n=1 Tax=Topomyia yanbarensis TaxID=2498891 RepID=UPI00273B90DD|nr:uncharacterized protein LOC131678379 [Topomyia yanbarensis]